MAKYTGNTVGFTISGIPCLLGVETCVVVEGNRSTWDSADDYYGYTDIEFVILDSKGYPAAWLERKMTKEDYDEASRVILEDYYDSRYQY